MFKSLLEVVGLEIMVEGIRADTYSDNWRKTIPDRRSCDTENFRWQFLYAGEHTG